MNDDPILAAWVDAYAGAFVLALLVWVECWRVQ